MHNTVIKRVPVACRDTYIEPGCEFVTQLRRYVQRYGIRTDHIEISSDLKDRFLVESRFSYESAYSGEWNSLSQRLAIWSCALEAVDRVFPLGYGTADGQLALESVYRERNYVRGYEDHYNAHNEFIYTILDLDPPVCCFSQSCWYYR
jgi:hypothetical protein